MKYRLLQSLALVFISVPAWPQVDHHADADQKVCAALVQPGGPVDSAEMIQPPFTVTQTYGPYGPKERPSYTVTVPFCRVAGTLKPEPKSEIHFELWLPPRSSWNGKFEGVGAGSSVGAIMYGSLLRGLMRNYAVVATDNGHVSQGSDVSWAAGHPERVVDFGYRAEHVVTQAAKDLTKDFYGRVPRYSYFVGCSQGGHHGMTEAQRFPDDYDGIIAGAPVYSWTDEMVDQAWNVRALQQIPSHALSKEKLALLAKSATQECAGPDGLIDDPRKCSFDPSTLVCKEGNVNQCLTGPEIEAVHQMYAGPKKSDGAQLTPGLSRGGESAWDLLWSNPEHLGGSWQGVFRYMVFDDPAWDIPKMNFDRDPELARKKLGSTLNPDNPDLSNFAKHGGKIIVYHGWADHMVPSEGSVNYFDSVLKTLGTTRVNDFYRLFMIPGMAHCGGGPGANVLFQSELATNIPLEPNRDMLTALEHWVSICAQARLFIPPVGITTIFNGEEIQQHTPVGQFTETLPSVLSDKEGMLKRTERKTDVQLYDTLPGEVAMIYEMGVPIVELGDDKWHVNVNQKVPVSRDRDNVNPSYIRKVRVGVLNAKFAEIVSTDDAGAKWVGDAMGHEKSTDAAVKHVMETRFGSDYVTRSVNDVGSVKEAVSQGKNVIEGGSMSKEEWARVKAIKAADGSSFLKSSHDVAPTDYDCSIKANEIIKPEDWTDAMANFAGVVEALAPKMIDKPVTVRYIDDEDNLIQGCFQKGVAPGRGRRYKREFGIITVNLAYHEVIGRKSLADNFDLMLHELAHNTLYSNDHLAQVFYDTVSELGGKLAVLAVTEPRLFGEDAFIEYITSMQASKAQAHQYAVAVGAAKRK